MFNLNHPQNSLQALPFHDLDDREFHILDGSCHLQIDNLKDLDLYNLLPNPDKSDDADPDHILINPQSDYYDISSLNKVLSKSGAKSFSFLHCNIRSLSKNIGLLEDMLYSLSEQPDVLGVSETRLNANTTFNTELINYNIYQADSPTPAGGVALYVSKALTSFPRSDITLDMPLVESVWVEIATPKNQKPILVGCIYKHPGANIDEFNGKLDETMKLFNPNKCQLYILGDMNIDFFKCDIHPPTEAYLDMLYSNNLLPIITKLTRLTYHSATLIQNCLWDCTGGCL